MYTRRGSGGSDVARSFVDREPVSAEYDTPWGRGTVSVRQGCLIGVDLPAVPAGARLGAARSAVAGSAAVRGGLGEAAVDPVDQAALDRWVAELEAYFRGERLTWSTGEVAMDELAAGSFDRAVYSALLSVPPAVTVSYGVLAEMAGYPRAARAVGNAMATNPIPVVIPCHRVIRSDGSLGNYGDDPAWKERLLAHERDHTGADVGKR